MNGNIVEASTKPVSATGTEGATASIDSTPNPTWILKPFTTGFVVISEIKKLEEKFAPQFNTLGENGQALLVAFNNLASAIKASSEQDNKGSGEQLKYPSDKTQTMNDMLESLFGMMKSLLLAVSENNQDEVHSKLSTADEKVKAFVPSFELGLTSNSKYSYYYLSEIFKKFLSSGIDINV
ncbi:hypothetical protein GGI25_004391 [Coemansia spiralis]|uniref:Uncharacterized protein n=2 Tax=Coemansia TaxID=4863 RepID=A0A9W8KX51_9FUNG|nr:hypothetical protein EDC05_000894 [Coemansia umbellata]KAJ2624831.1 hypothetical protein GGI26_001247 [Coemansia sp. RSA 1358]KAJ2674370.1 hypothetical protein GGI25_004391 [Coemansia spiralis]